MLRVNSPAITLGVGEFKWFGVNSSHLDSHCGELPEYPLSEALDGINSWIHYEDCAPHWFILDLGATYTIWKVRARSNEGGMDPTNVDIYVSDDKENWGVAVSAGINVWQDTTEWVEVNVVHKSGRYVKVEIIETESTPDLGWGIAASPNKIFDIFCYG